MRRLIESVTFKGIRSVVYEEDGVFTLLVFKGNRKVKDECLPSDTDCAGARQAAKQARQAQEKSSCIAQSGRVA